MMKILVDEMPKKDELCPFYTEFYGAFSGKPLHICKFCNDGESLSTRHDCTGVNNCRYFKANNTDSEDDGTRPYYANEWI